MGATRSSGRMPPARNPGSNITSRRTRGTISSPTLQRKKWPAQTLTTICEICMSQSPAAAPSWTLEMQIMPFDDAATYRFNPFDLTKVWPHGDYPPIKIGQLTLNRNPENYFAEIEPAAFEPANMVPGIGPSPDKVLLGRLFA